MKKQNRMPCAGLNNPAHGIRFCMAAAPAKTRKRLHPKPDVAFNMAERKGFEPLRALGALHDFQSCALDQLSHLSIYSAVSPHLTTCYIIASTSGIVKQYFEKNQFFSNKFKKRKKEHMEEVFCENDLKSKGGYKHMPFLPQPQYGMNCPANAPFVQDICAYR